MYWDSGLPSLSKTTARGFLNSEVEAIARQPISLLRERISVAQATQQRPSIRLLPPRFGSADYHSGLAQSVPGPLYATWLDFSSRNSYHSSMKTVVSEKGQVTIPKPIRDRLGIRAGQALDFRAEQGQLVATKITPQDAVESVYGILKLGRPTDAVMKTLRGTASAR